MPIGASLRTYLLADSAIAAVVGTRIYPVQLPQNPTLPAVSYVKVSGLRHHHTLGAQGLSRPRIQIDCWAAIYADAVALAELIRLRIDGKRTTMGSHVVQGVFLDGEREFFEDEPQQWRISRDYMVWFEEE